MVPLLAGNNWGEGVSVEGFKKDPDTDDGSRYNAVGAELLPRARRAAARRPRLHGERRRRRAAKVAIVNEAFAKKFNLGTNAVGKHMSMGNDSLNITIVGLVKDSKYSQVKDKIPPVFVLPVPTGRPVGDEQLLRANARCRPSRSCARFPALMKKLDPNLPLERLKTAAAAGRRERVHGSHDLDARRRRSPRWRRCSRRSGCTACSPIRSRSARARSASAWRSARTAAPCAAMVLKQVGADDARSAASIGIAGAIALGRGAQSLLFELKGYDPVVIVAACRDAHARRVRCGIHSGDAREPRRSDGRCATSSPESS